MAVTYTTTQIAPLSANAGLQQNISVSSPSAQYFSSPGASNPTTLQNGPGWASTTGSYSTATPSASSVSSPSNWPTYLVILALAYFAFKKLGG